jgi:hypothetical protein
MQARVTLERWASWRDACSGEQVHELKTCIWSCRAADCRRSGGHPLSTPAWFVLLVGSTLMAAIFVVARRKTDYEALDPTFRSHIPSFRKQPEDR